MYPLSEVSWTITPTSSKLLAKMPSYPMSMHKPLLSTVALAAVIASILPPLVEAQSLSSKAIKSTVFIGTFVGEKYVGRASGVIITREGHVATNRHVVEDDFGHSIADLWVIPTSTNEELDFDCAWQPKKYRSNKQIDVAVLEPPPSKLPCSVDFVTPSKSLATTGTDVRIMGYPGTSYGSYTLTTLKGVISGPVNENGVTIYQKTDTKIIAGNSGGPVFDMNNNLVGLAAATTTTRKVGEEVLGLIVPAMHIYSVFTPSGGASTSNGNLPPDVGSADWFSSAIGEFTAAGHISPNASFRPGDMATRAEFIDLLIKAKGGIRGQYQSPSFSDVPLSSPYFAAFEEAGVNGWVKGSGDCYGRKPCNAKPNDRVNRAEAAALLNRAFGLASLNEAPAFSDNTEGAWFYDAIRTAADHCVLKGDANTGRVRPGDPMNRAEMAVMISRITKGQTYRNGCGEGQSSTNRQTTKTTTPKAETINDPSKSPINTCKNVNAIYNSSTGKCACAAGYTWNKAVTMCVTLDARCKENDKNAGYDPVRDTCQCENGTEPSADGKSCRPSCEATYGYASYRTSTGQCTCMSGYFLKNGQCTLKPYCGGGTFNEVSGTCNCSNGYYEKKDGSCGVTPFCGDGRFDDVNEVCVCYQGATMKAGGYCSKY